MTDTSAINPYAAPASELKKDVSHGQVPSIEEALSRGYDFSIGQVLSESWARVKGTKGIIIVGFIVFYVALMIVTSILGAVFGLLGANEESLVMMFIGQVVASLVGTALAYPFFAGVNMIGIRRAADQELSFNEIFSHFNKLTPILITSLVMSVLIQIGFLLLIVPGLYLSVAYMLAIPLVVERGLSPWQALETSRKAISQHWFKASGLCALLGLLVIVGMLPLGIGLIWVIPLFVVALGVFYRIIFGVLPQQA